MFFVMFMVLVGILVESLSVCLGVDGVLVIDLIDMEIDDLVVRVCVYGLEFVVVSLLFVYLDLDYEVCLGCVLESVGLMVSLFSGVLFIRGEYECGMVIWLNVWLVLCIYYYISWLRVYMVFLLLIIM